MRSELTQFSQQVFSGTVRWHDAEPIDPSEKPGRGRFLVQEPSIAPPRRYAPLRRWPALFRTFADLDISEPAVEGFAREYGFLGSPQVLRGLSERGGNLQGESWELWRSEIATLRHLVNIWEALKTKNARALQTYFRWRGRQDVVFSSAGDEFGGRAQFSIIASESRRGEVFTRFRHGDLMAPAEWHLQDAINDELQRKQVGARLLWDARLKHLRLHIAPVSLIGAIWLQFANAVEGEKQYRHCENCRDWIEIGGTRASRSDKKFCSPTCKATAHRKKHERALELAAQGASAQGIALELAVKVGTVEGWIKSS